MNDCKNRIIDQAALMFQSYGIRAVTMDMLASSLGISKRTIYENFRDKDELLVTVMRCMEEKRKDLVEATLKESGNSIEAIFRLLRVTGDHFRRMNPVFYSDLKKYQHIFEERGVCSMPDLSGSLKIIEQGIAEGSFTGDLNPELVNRVMYGIFRLTGDFDLFPASDFSREAIVRNIYINYLKGICTPKGIRLIEKYLSGFDISF